jgi:glycosyltransferase involved in cell wall biosynthesis
MTNNSPLRILFVYYEPFESGQTKHVLSLARGLNRTRFQVEVLLPDHLLSAAKQFQEVGLDVTRLPIRKAYWKPYAIYYLIRSIREKHFSVVHVHSQEAALVARLPAKLAGAKTIIYTPQTIDIRQKKYAKLYSKIERLQSFITDRIISVNESDRKRLESWGISSEKSVTIYNGIDLNDFKHPRDSSEIRQSLGLRPSGTLVMQIGRLTAQKSPLDFVEGAAVILKMRPGVQFIMIGDGPLFPRVNQRIKELGLESSIIIAGKRNDADQLIPAASIVTLTSLWEGTPYTILEAMAWKKPVVATYVNGCPEIIDDHQNGLLVPPGDPEKWAQAVMELIDRPDIAEEFGCTGRQRIEERFSLDRMVDAVTNLYGKLEF